MELSKNYGFLNLKNIENMGFSLALVQLCHFQNTAFISLPSRIPGLRTMVKHDDHAMTWNDHRDSFSYRIHILYNCLISALSIQIRAKKIGKKSKKYNKFCQKKLNWKNSRKTTRQRKSIFVSHKDQKESKTLLWKYIILKTSYEILWLFRKTNQSTSS